MREFNRRSFLAMLAASSAVDAFGQMASREVSAQKRLPPSGRPFLAHFSDVAQQAGLIHPTIYGGVDHKANIVETVGCGCAFLDYDNDGWMDIFLLCGTRLDGAPQGATNRLYRNNRDGSFKDVTDEAGLRAIGWASGVCVGDYNNDGFEDLFCTYYGQNRLYRNNGNGTFTDVTKESGLWNAKARWGAGCSFVDYNRDGYLDLFVSNYVDIDFNNMPKPGQDPTCNWKGVPVNCGPRGLKTGRHTLYRNNGDGTFTDVSRESGIDKAADTYGMTVIAADLDGDGWQDILVACDSTPSLLFMNNHDGTLREEAVSRGIAYNGDGSEQAGMGLGVGDYNLDGHLDIARTHFTEDTLGLFYNDGKGNFTDRTLPARLGVETRFVCWGVGIVDLDNDGWPDIFMVTGNVYPEIERSIPQFANKTPRVIFRNLGNGSFEELGSEGGLAINEPHCSRGCAFGDFDNDGDLDILIVNLNEPPSLLRNDLKGKHHWIKVKLVGVTSNRSAIGSRVLVHYDGKMQVQSVLSQSGFYSSSDPRLHFGLGSSATVDIEIFWTSGERSSLQKVSANRLVTIKEGIGIIPNLGWSKDDKS